MFESAEFDHKVEAAFMIMKRSSEVREDALKWFESELKVERERVWRKLMSEKNIDLSSAMPYLIKINQADAAWRAMNDMSRKYVYGWQRRINFTILEMFILRHKASVWNHFENTSQRNNSNVEGFHSMLNKRCWPHLNLFGCIEVIKNIQQENTVSMEMLSAGKIKPVKSQVKYRKIGEKLAHLKDNLSRKRILFTEYIDEVGKLLHSKD